MVGRSTEFRQHSRAPLQVPATIRFEDEEESVSGVTANVSEGGMFLAVDDPKPVGTLASFELELARDEVVTGFAEVVWIRVESAARDRPSGMGIAFRSLSEHGDVLIRKHVQPLLT